MPNASLVLLQPVSTSFPGPNPGLIATDYATIQTTTADASGNFRFTGVTGSNNFIVFVLGPTELATQPPDEVFNYYGGS